MAVARVAARAVAPEPEWQRPWDNPECCFLCYRRADGLGTIGPKKKVGWLCNECVPLGRIAAKMADRAFDPFEQRAIERGGEKAGAYLDQIGKTDLAALTPDEWRHFLRTFIRAFGEAIRSEVEGGKPPF